MCWACHRSSVIIDSGLRQAAETFVLQLSSRFIYDVLGASLLEEEGLLDDFMVQRVRPSIRTLVGFFDGRERGRCEACHGTGKLARESKLAIRLHGRGDATDQSLAEILRLLAGSKLNSIERTRKLSSQAPSRRQLATPACCP
jgi:hypothetical protein